MNERYLWKAALCAAFLLIFQGQPSSVSAQVALSPVRVDLSDDHDKGIVRVSSQADSTLSYQVEVVSWSQSGEQREIYAPTEDILAVPPLFTLEPGDEQVVRIGMLIDADPAKERAYRMFITELAAPQEEESETTGVNMRLRLGIPVFVAPRAIPNATLTHVGSEYAEGRLFMHMKNSGNTHVRISEVRFQAPGMAEAQVESAALYLLAGQAAPVQVGLPEGNRFGKVTLVTDTLGVVEYALAATD